MASVLKTAAVSLQVAIGLWAATVDRVMEWIPGLRIHLTFRSCVTICSIVSLLLLCPMKASSEPVISEFLAVSRGGFLDEDGDASDWLEIRNDGLDTLNLEGWYLTDNLEELTRWEFPGVSIRPHEHLVVFASGKDRASPELHTNFRLDADGEALALVAPDGQTIVHSYVPAYPQQQLGTSYGLGRASIPLIERQSAAWLLIPGEAPGADWALVDFDMPAAWADSAAAVGFTRSNDPGPPAGLVGYWPLDGSFDDFAGNNEGAFQGPGPAQFSDGPVEGASLCLDGSSQYVRVAQNDSLPIFQHEAFSVSLWVRGGPQADRRVFSEGSGSNNRPVFNIGTDASGRTGSVDIYIRDAGGALLRGHTQSTGTAFDGEWHHLAWVDLDGDAALYIDGDRDATDFSYPKRPIAFDRTSIGAILRSGPSYFFDGCLGEVSLWDRALAGGDIAALAEGGSPMSLAGSALEGLIETDIGAEMENGATTAFLRVPFEVADPGAIGSLLLELNYGDGFIAYLNGLEVARANAPVDGAWDGAATVNRSVAEVLSTSRFVIEAPAPQLRRGLNILAIQGFKASADDPDFLVAPRLVARFSESSAWFAEPTPGEDNSAGSRFLVAAVEMDAEGGIYEDSFELSLSTSTRDARIFYTLDGSDPDETAGIEAIGPVVITEATVLRAAAFHELGVTSPIVTRSFLLVDRVLEQGVPVNWPSSWGSLTADYEMDPELAADPEFRESARAGLLSLPSLSLVMPQDSLFGPRGIYDHSTNSGISWERTCSAEWFSDGGSFQVDAGVRIMGNRSRSPSSSPKHGFRLIFRGCYGASKLDFPLFSGEVDNFDTLAIRPNAFDSWVSDNSGQRRGGTYLRDDWVRSAEAATGNLSARSHLIHLYLNGLYWGVYSLIERPDASFGAEHMGGSKSEYDSIKTHEEVVDGNRAAYDTLDSMRAAGLSGERAYLAVQDYLDVSNLANYMIVNMLAPSTDWPGNYYMVRRRGPRTNGFRLFSWDSEYAFLGGVRNNRTLPHRRDPDSPTKFYHALRANEEFRSLFADRLQQLLTGDGILSPGGVAARWEELADHIEPALYAESMRWGDYRRSTPYRPDVEWAAEREYLLNDHFPQRSEILLGQFRAQGMYPDVAAPTYSRYGGLVGPGYVLTLDAPVGAIYYSLDGTDPRLVGGGLHPDVHLHEGDSISIFEDTEVLARSRRAGEWSALERAVFVTDEPTPLRLTEIMYHPPEPQQMAEGIEADDFEFIEVLNTSANSVSLAGQVIDSGVGFTFRDGLKSVLGPGEAGVLVSHLDSFLERYPDAGESVLGEYQRQLGNGGDRLEWRDAVGRVLLAVTFEDTWYPRTDGEGYSLTIRSLEAPTDSINTAEAWIPGSVFLGTPGTVENIGPDNFRLPGDSNEDGLLDLSDAIRLLGILFLLGDGELPCGADEISDPGVRELLDVNGDLGVDLTDAISLLLYLFQGGVPPALGSTCRSMPPCEGICPGG